MPDLTREEIVYRLRRELPWVMWDRHAGPDPGPTTAEEVAEFIEKLLAESRHPAGA